MIVITRFYSTTVKKLANISLLYIEFSNLFCSNINSFKEGFAIFTISKVEIKVHRTI